MTQENQIPSSLPEEPRRNNTAWIVILVALVLVVCCCLLSILLALWGLWNYGDNLLAYSLSAFIGWF